MSRRLAVLALFLSRAALAAVAVDSEMPSQVGQGCTACASPWTFTFTNTAGGLIVCGISSGGGAGDSSAVSYNSAALSEDISTTTGNQDFADIWHRLSPSTGTALNVTTTFPAPRDIQGGCITTTGHDTTTPIRATTFTATGVSAGPATVTVTGTTTGSLLLGSASTGTCFGTGACGTLPVTSAGTTLSFLKNQNAGTFASNGIMGRRAGDGTSLAVSFILQASDTWDISAVEVMPDAGGGATPSPQGGFYLPDVDFLPRGGTLGRGRLAALRTKFLFDPLAREDLLDVSAPWLTPDTTLICQVLDEVPMSVSVVERGTGTAKLLVSTSLIGPIDPVQIQCIGGTPQ